MTRRLDNYDVIEHIIHNRVLFEQATHTRSTSSLPDGGRSGRITHAVQ